MDSGKKFVIVCCGLLVLSMVFIHGCVADKTGESKKYPFAIDINQALEKENVIPVVILGSGPAGLSAAIYSARANLRTVVLHGDVPGGQLAGTTDVENWPGSKRIMGPDLIDNMHDQAEYLGAEFMHDVVEKVDFSQWPFTLHTEDGKTIHALTVIIAAGATPQKLGIPGEQEYWGKGVTTCAICDAPFYKKRDVIVIGGGDSAVEEGLQLAPHAKSITIFVRKGRMRAAPRMQDHLAEQPHISVVYNTEVKKIVGDEHHVTGVDLYNNATEETYHKPIDGVFLAIGHIPNTKIFQDYLDIDDGGYLQVIGRTQHTNIPGVFAAGDVEDKQYRQAGVAAGSGIRAALDAAAFLSDIGFTGKIAAQLETKGFKVVAEEAEEVLQIKSLKDFEREVTKSDLPVFVDFYADYCPSCMQMLPIVDSVAAQFKDKIKFVKVDADEGVDLVKKFHILKVPALLAFKDGQLMARINNAMNKKELTELVEQLISS